MTTKKVLVILLTIAMIVAMFTPTGLAANQSLSYQAGNGTTQIVITYDDSLGTVTRTGVSGGDADNNFEHGETWTFTATPKPGYVFDSWTFTGSSYVNGESDSSATLSFSFRDGNKGLSDDSSRQFTALANFIPVPTYTVTYDANDGSGTVPVDSNVYHQGDTVTVQNPLGTGLTRSGYRFVGWSANRDSYRESNEYGQGRTSYTMGSGNVTFYALWESTSKTYDHVDVRLNGSITIDYKINGVSQPGYPKTLSITTSNVTGSYKTSSGGSSTNLGTFSYRSSDGGEWSVSKNINWPYSVTINATLSDGSTTYPFSHTFTGAEIYAAHVECPTDEGFDFILNASDISDQIAHDVTFKTTAGGTINGGTTDIIHTDLLDGSSSPTPPTTSANSGYQFLGWTKNSGTTLYTSAQVDAMTITADTVFTAQYGAEFRVRNNNGPGGDHGYIAVSYNGQTVNLDAGQEHTFGYYAPAGDVSIDFVPDANYTFEYYVIGNGATHINDDPDLIDPSSYAGQPGANNRIDVNPKWKSTISYLIDTTVVGGTINPGDTNVTQGEDQTFTYSPNAHYHLVSVVVDGVNVTAGHGSSYTFTNVMTAHTIIVTYAIDTYTVTWNNWNNSQLEKDLNVAYNSTPVYNGSTPTKPSDAQYDYTFSGWSPVVSAVTGDVTYTAQFTPELRSYTVTWNNYDNIQLEQDTDVDYGTTPTYDGATPTKPSTAQYDYTFNGWSPTVSAVTGDVTYTAQFTETLRSYTVTFYDYNGNVLGTDTVAYGSGATAPANPDNQTGYHFTGWNKDFSNVTGNLDVTAVYAINTYTVRFFGADGVTQIGTSQTVNWGGAAVVETAPVRAGLTFTGWVVTGDDPTVATNLNNVRENINAVASYNATIYTVRFEDFDGTLLGTDRVPSGGDAIPPANPEREGYDFTGWSPSYDNVTGNITVVAEYEIKTFTVTFVDFDGTVIDEQTVDWNTGATAPEAPAREGFEFTGWDKAFDPVTADLTVTAQYAAIEAPTPTPEPTEIPPEAPPTTGGGGTWLWWLLLIPALGILIWLILAWLTIVPIAEAVTKNADGTMTIRWGYENRKLRKQKVEPEDSELTALAGQIINSSAVPPVEFEKGRVENVFTTTAAANAVVQWKIRNRKAKVDLSKGEKK